MAELETIGTRAFVVRGLVERAQCAQYIAEAEARGFGEAPVNGRLGEQRVASVRNNDRVMVDDEEGARWLWERLEAFLPYAWREVPGIVVGEPGSRLVASGLNERLRYYRYEPGQYFKPHRDGRFEREDGSALSLMTVLLYLNDVEQGGETRLWEGRDQVDVAPRAGDVLCFDHAMLHEGRELSGGVKYVLRSDIMYRFCC